MALPLSIDLVPADDEHDAPILRSADWTEHAVCKGKTHLFFGLPGERPERRARREGLARKYCAACPVMLACRGEARQNRENGFWGGESEEERAAAGFAPRSISRRGVLAAARQAAS